MAKRIQQCFNCGEEMGVFDNYGEIVTCGKLECDKQARKQYEAEIEEARHEAEKDEFERYRR